MCNNFYYVFIVIFRVHRHSKSLDTEKKVCGYCNGQFELVVTGKRNNQICETPKFAQFVKENYSSVRKEHGTLVNVKHVDVMRALSEKFKAAATLSQDDEEATQGSSSDI